MDLSVYALALIDFAGEHPFLPSASSPSWSSAAHDWLKRGRTSLPPL